MFLRPNLENLGTIDSENFQEIELVEDKIISENQPDNKSKSSNFNIIPNGDINEDEYMLKNNKNPLKDGKNSAISHKSGFCYIY